MRVTIMGGGSVALANASYLGAQGHEVTLWSAIGDEREAWRRAGRIEYDGYISGSVAVNADEDVGTCVARAEVIMFCAPCFAHRALMNAAAPHMRDDQYAIVHPVTGLSSLLLSRALSLEGKRPLIIDLSTSLFPSRASGACSVKLLRVKERIEAAAIPAQRNPEGLSLLQSLYGDRFQLEPNAIAISINNHNPVYHVPPLLCNLSRAEKAESWVIWDCITPGIARFIELLDSERLAVGAAFGVAPVPVQRYFEQSYGAGGEDLHAVIQDVYRKMRAPAGPTAMQHRFVLEDVPYGLVFFSAMGRLAGVATPLMDHLIGLTSALYGRDFVAEGHTPELLGLAGCDPQQVLDITAQGFGVER